jgi:hypothetical protein
MPKFASDYRAEDQNDFVRKYRNPNRHDNQYVYRSVTNVTGALPKPALIRWAAKITAETAVEQLEAWSNMPAYEAVDWLKQTPYRNRDRAGSRGTNIHKVIDNILQGQSYEIEAQAVPWLESAQRFISDARPRPERTETSIYDERSLTAGTFDFLGRLDTAPELGRVLIDWKTSAGVYADMAVQLVGGYALGAQYILDDEGHEIEWRMPDTCLLCHFTQDGYAIRPVPIDKTLRRAFLGAVEIRRWEDEGPQIGKPYQLKLDIDGPPFSNMPSDAELAHVRSRLRFLTHEAQLAVSALCVEQGVTTKLKQMTIDDMDKMLGLVKLYEMGEPVPEQQTPEPPAEPAPLPRRGRRTGRPMP